MAASSSSASTGLSMRLRRPWASISDSHSRRSRQATGRASLEPTVTSARSIACSSIVLTLAFLAARLHVGDPGQLNASEGAFCRSEIRLCGAREREQTLVEVVFVVLGADRLDQRVGDLAPALDQIERLVERIGIVDLHERLDPVAVVDELDAFGDVQLLGVRRAEIVDVAVLGLQPDRVDEQGAVTLITAHRVAEP